MREIVCALEISGGIEEIRLMLETIREVSEKILMLVS